MNRVLGVPHYNYSTSYPQNPILIIKAPTLLRPTGWMLTMLGLGVPTLIHFSGDLLRKGTILKIKVYIYFFLPGYFKAQNEVMRLHRVQEAFVRYS